MTDLIKVEISGETIAITDEAKVLASNLWNELAAITVVNSPATQSVATDHARNAQTFLKQLEACRKSVKAPVLELGKRIDTLADELAAPVKEQMNRVGAMVAKFQTAEAARVAEEQRQKRIAEQAAIKAKFEADRLAREAEAKLNTEADLAKALEAEEEAKRKEAAMYAELTKAAPAPVKATGSVTKKVLKWEITDKTALYAAAPHLFKLEENITAIKTCCNETTKLPGIRFWTELDTSFRGK
jgi:hypothetical protein